MIIWTYLLVFVLAAIPFFEILAIIPIAIIGGLPTIPVIIFSLLGNLLTLYFLIAFIDLLKVFLPGKKKKDPIPEEDDFEETASFTEVETMNEASETDNINLENESIQTNRDVHEEDPIQVAETIEETTQAEDTETRGTKLSDTLANAGNKDNSRNKKGRQIWDKFGLPGLALVGPFVTGSHLAAFFALTFGATKRKTTIWFTISLTLWALAAGILTHYGVGFFAKDIDTDGFIMKLLNQDN